MVTNLPALPRRTKPLRSNLNDLLTISAVGVTALMLAACGGAGAGGQDNPDSPAGSGGIGSPPAQNDTSLSTGFSYTMLPPASSPAIFSTQAEDQSDEGYRFSTTGVFGGISRDLYIRNNNLPSTYEYELLAPASTLDALLVQANDRGAAGFRFRGNHLFGSSNETKALYTRNANQPVNRLYESLGQTHSEAARLQQLNDQGGRGYRFVSDFDMGSNVSFSLYAQNQNTAETYTYKLIEPASNESDFVTLLNTEGGRGYRYRGDIILSDDSTTRSIFVIRTDTPGTYRYEIHTPEQTAAAFLANANERGANNLLRQGEFSIGGNVISLYVDTSNCNCTPLQLAEPLID